MQLRSFRRRSWWMHIRVRAASVVADLLQVNEATE
jgi:hypothetical protein